MNRSSFTRVVVVSGLLAVTALGQAGLVCAAETKPNILFFLADDLGWRDTSGLGNPNLSTPNLDRIMRGGVSLKGVQPETLESKHLRGLYLAGEMLDLDGPCGGFNLQWAFSSGHLAGCAAAASADGCVPI